MADLTLTCWLPSAGMGKGYALNVPLRDGVTGQWCRLVFPMSAGLRVCGAAASHAATRLLRTAPAHRVTCMYPTCTVLTCTVLTCMFLTSPNADEAYHSLFKPVMAKIMEVYQPEAVVLQCGRYSHPLSGPRCLWWCGVAAKIMDQPEAVVLQCGERRAPTCWEAA